MIRLVQKKLIIPRGDTGTLKVPVLRLLDNQVAAIFTIIDSMTNKKIWSQIAEKVENNFIITFKHADTVHWPIGKFYWDIKFYVNPVIVEGAIIDGEEIDSYYAAYSLPICEIRQTGDSLLTSDDLPTSTLSPENINLLRETIQQAQRAEATADAASETANQAMDTADEASEIANSAYSNITEVLEIINETQEVINEKVDELNTLINADSGYDIGNSEYNALDIIKEFPDNIEGMSIARYGDEFRIIGTNTAVQDSTQWLVIFNGNCQNCDTTTEFIKVLDAGTYRITAKIRARNTNEYIPASIDYTYTTFDNVVSAQDGELLVLSAPAMFGYKITGQTNYGSDFETDYTAIEVQAMPIISANVVENKVNPYAPHAIKLPRYPNQQGFAHQAFPDVDFFNGNEVIISRVSNSHHTPDDPQEWGGIEIDTVSPEGKLKYIKTITSTDIDPTLYGELRDCYVHTFNDKLLMCGWTTYHVENESDGHNSFITLLDKNFNFIGETATIVNPVEDLSIVGKPLITPEGKLIFCGYRRGQVSVCVSNEVFNGTFFAREGNELVNTISFARILITDGITSDFSGSECSLGYHDDKLYLFMRNNTSNQASCLYVTDDLEGMTGWELVKAYDRGVDSYNTIIHSPRLLPFSTGRYLLFAGANYRNATTRNSVFGAIDLKDENFTIHLGIIADELNYGGYTGIVARGGDEYDVAYHREGVTMNQANALSSAVYYKRINAKILLPEIFNNRIELSNANIPTKTSELINDSNFIIDSNYTHTDQNYTTNEKEKLSRIEDGAEVNVNADWQATSGAAAILNKPTVLSAFTNDVGYLTQHQDITGKQDQLTFDSIPTTASTNPVTSDGIKNYVDNAISNINALDIHICSSNEYNSSTGVPTITNPATSTFYLVPDGSGNNLYIEWMYVNSAWEQFGSASIDLTGYVLRNDLAAVALSGSYNDLNTKPIIPTKTSDLINDSSFITNADLPTKISDLTDDSNHYIKPVNGIPASDLANDVIPVKDVQVNGMSALQNGIAAIQEGLEVVRLI